MRNIPFSALGKLRVIVLCVSLCLCCGALQFDVLDQTTFCNLNWAKAS